MEIIKRKPIVYVKRARPNLDHLGVSSSEEEMKSISTKKVKKSVDNWDRDENGDKIFIEDN